MARVAAILATGVVAVAGGVAGAYGYEELLADDDAPTVVQQAPVASGQTQPSNENAGSGLTPAEIYERTADGTVLIQALVTEGGDSPFGDQTQQNGVATGTGFVVSKEGFIVTNAHVVEGAKAATVQFGESKQIDAEVVGTDVNSDLAVLKIDPEAHDLVPLELGSTEGLKVGDPVVAIGNPYGLDRTLTTGVVSALARQIRALNDFTINDVIQTDAAINRGNSGGPLFDSQGRVIGVNSQIQTETGGNVGIGFAVPVERLKKVLPTLEQGKQVKVAFLGVSTLPIDATLRRLGQGREGLLVEEVTSGSAAAKAGLRGGDPRTTVTIDGAEINLGGDVITRVDGKTFGTPQELADYVSGKEVGDTVTIEYRREGEEKSTKVTLGQRPNRVTQEP